jgi:hypothetical protein
VGVHFRFRTVLWRRQLRKHTCVSCVHGETSPKGHWSSLDAHWTSHDEHEHVAWTFGRRLCPEGSWWRKQGLCRLNWQRPFFCQESCSWAHSQLKSSANHLSQIVQDRKSTPASAGGLQSQVCRSVLDHQTCASTIRYLGSFLALGSDSQSHPQWWQRFHQFH